MGDDEWFRRSWPEGPLRGKFAVPRRVATETGQLLRTFRGDDGRHEGLVFWGGVERPDLTEYRAAARPECDHGRGHVQANETQVFRVVREFRTAGLGLLVQVHSHPGPYTRHSYGDDHRVFLPFEGMLSIVVANYGRGGMLPLTRCSIHQFQNGEWVLCTSQLENFSVR